MGNLSTCRQSRCGDWRITVSVFPDSLSLSGKHAVFHGIGSVEASGFPLFRFVRMTKTVRWEIRFPAGFSGATWFCCAVKHIIHWI